MTNKEESVAIEVRHRCRKDDDSTWNPYIKATASPGEDLYWQMHNGSHITFCPYCGDRLRETAPMLAEPAVAS